MEQTLFTLICSDVLKEFHLSIFLKYCSQRSCLWFFLYFNKCQMYFFVKSVIVANLKFVLWEREKSYKVSLSPLFVALRTAAFV